MQIAEFCTLEPIPQPRAQSLTLGRAKVSRERVKWSSAKSTGALD
jgi:hypothetical protein